MSCYCRERYEAFVEEARRTLMLNQQDKRNENARLGIGPDVGLTPRFLRWKVGRWFSPDGWWRPNFGRSLVALLRENEQLPPNKSLHRNLVRAQREIGEVLKDAWRRLPPEQLHITLCPIDVRTIDRRRGKPLSNVESTIERLGPELDDLRKAFHSLVFAVDFLGVFQSPLDGRLNAWGIPTACAHHPIITAIRTDIGKQAHPLPLVHIALGSIVEPISAGCFGLLHMIVDSHLNGYENCGTFVAERITLVHHANDHMDGLGTKDEEHWDL